MGQMRFAGYAVALWAATQPSLGESRPQPAETSTVRAESRAYRYTLKQRRVELPEAEREAVGKQVEVRTGPRALVRRTVIDAPAKGGKFVRTVRTLTIEPKGKTDPKWQHPADPLAPHWSPAKADYLFSSKRLGPTYGKDSATLRLFAPRAKRVDLVLDDSHERLPMAADYSGVWERTLPRAPASLYGNRYHFEVDGRTISDPYAQSTAGDFGPARFANLDFDWHDGGFKAPARAADWVISEAHVADTTKSPSSPVAKARRGTYRGMTSPEILAHYRKLGVNAVEIMPLHQSDRAQGKHWGYMTTHFFAPETRYASSQAAAPHELQGLVDTLHRNGQAVVMDVVYNHSANGSNLHFAVLGNDYYYRLAPDGTKHDGAAVGNELATERPMVRKMIIDSLRLFVDRYHVDGFRFDVGSLIDKQTMRTIDRALPRRIFMTGEPWAARWERAQWGKGDLDDTRLSYWNDEFREPVNHFVVGKGDRNRVMTAIAGSVRPHGFGRSPGHALNYLESHDELTLADRVGWKGERRDLLGAVLQLTSQGPTMLGQGQEMMRSKRGVKNAYDQDNPISWVNWRQARDNRGVVDAYSKLIALRAKYPNFRYGRPLGAKDIQWLLPSNPNALGYLVRPPREAKGRRATPDFLVLANSDGAKWVTFDLPRAGDWRVVMDGQRVDESGRLGSARGTYAVPPGSAVILSQPHTN